MRLLDYFKSIFVDTDTNTNGEFDMRSVNNTATIRQMKNGRFRLLANGNEVVATYGRKRDAIRGAGRRGLSLIAA